MEKIEKIPFQLQITYKEPNDGSKLMRVLTQFKPQTRDRSVAEKNSSFNMLAKHTLSTQAKQISENFLNNKHFSSQAYESKLKSVSNYLNSQ